MVRPIGDRSIYDWTSINLAGNETAMIDFCLEYVEAQLEYFRTSRNADGILVFAQKLRSSPGGREGLYWPIGHGDDGEALVRRLQALLELGRPIRLERFT